MFFLNLSLGEFLALWGVVSGAVLALYLLDRSRRKIKVATLRFWQPSEKPPEAKHRKRIQQPWSMLLQLLGIGLLLAALAQLRLGSPDKASRDHILILDASAWTAARTGQQTLLDQAKRQSILWLRSLPASDRVMLVRADALPAPATVFETNRGVIEQAILETKPGAASVNVKSTLDFARQMQRQHTAGQGDIVLAGAFRGHGNDLPAASELPGNLRLLPVTGAVRNVGIRKVTLRRSPNDAELWEVFVSVRNYGTAAEAVPLGVTFGNAPIGSARLTLAPESEQNTRLEFRTKAAGWLEARLLTRDAIAADNVATLELPEQKLVRVNVYTRQPELLRPLLAANRWLTASYAPPEAYRAAAEADIVILDRFSPPQKPQRNAIWIAPPAEGSAVPVASVAEGVKLTGWRNTHPIAAGLRSLDQKLDRTDVFRPAEPVEVVAESDAGPVVVAQAGGPRSVWFGFHPGLGALRYELTAPLLMANTLEWLAPEVMRRREVTGESVGNVEVAVDSGIDPASIKVTGEGEAALPFSVSGGTLRFYAGQPGTVRVQTGAREQVLSLTLPDVADTAWEIPAGVRRGIRRGLTDSVASVDIWPWLALAGGVLIFAEWILYGLMRLPAAAAAPAPVSEMLRRFTAPFRKAS